MAAVILVIDEELNLRLTITQILREAGYIVVDADKACEARDLLPLRHFDLIFLNLKSHSPGEMGFLNETREQYPHLPLLVLNAYPRSESAGFGDPRAEMRFLVKPIDPPAILDAVKCMLARQN